MATKRGKRSGAKGAKAKQAIPRSRSAGRSTERRRPPASGRAQRGGSTPVRKRTTAASGTSGTATKRTLLESAERLRDAIHRSKLTAANPWTYTPKARRWSQTAQALVDEIARGREAPQLRQQLDGLTAQVEADRDFQEARRLF